MVKEMFQFRNELHNEIAKKAKKILKKENPICLIGKDEDQIDGLVIETINRFTKKNAFWPKYSLAESVCDGFVSRDANDRKLSFAIASEIGAEIIASEIKNC